MEKFGNFLRQSFRRSNNKKSSESSGEDFVKKVDNFRTYVELSEVEYQIFSLENFKTKIKRYYKNCLGKLGASEGNLLQLPLKEPAVADSIILSGNKSDGARDRKVSECSMMSEATPSECCLDDDSVIISDLQPIYENASLNCNKYYQKRSIYIERENRFKRLDVRIVKLPENTVEVKFKDRKEFIIDEMITTEESYLASLEHIFKNYVNYVEENLGIPIFLKMFSNLDLIFKKTKLFLNDLLDSKNDFEKVGIAFLKHKSLFDMYPEYCINKPKADKLCEEHAEILQIKEDEQNDESLISLLYIPIERLSKYRLLLNTLNKQLIKDETETHCIPRALTLITNVLSRANDTISLNIIKGQDYTLVDTGNFIFNDKFRLLSPKRMEVDAFLFRKKIIITTKDPKEKDSYIFNKEIDMEKVSFMDESENATCFLLLNYTEKPPASIRVDAKTAIVKNKWLDEIKRLLSGHIEKYKEDVYRRYSVPVLLQAPNER